MVFERGFRVPLGSAFRAGFGPTLGSGLGFSLRFRFGLGFGFLLTARGAAGGTVLRFLGRSFTAALRLLFFLLAEAGRGGAWRGGDRFGSFSLVFVRTTRRLPKIRVAGYRLELRRVSVPVH
jgi:hypothetical protein